MGSVSRDDGAGLHPDGLPLLPDLHRRPSQLLPYQRLQELGYVLFLPRPFLSLYFSTLVLPVTFQTVLDLPMNFLFDFLSL